MFSFYSGNVQEYWYLLGAIPNADFPSGSPLKPRFWSLSFPRWVPDKFII